MYQTFNCDKCHYRWTNSHNSDCPKCAGLGLKHQNCTCPHVHVGQAIEATQRTATDPACPVHGEKAVVGADAVVEEARPYPIAFVAKGLKGDDQYYRNDAKDLVARLASSTGRRRFVTQIFDDTALATAFLFSQPGSEWERTLVFMSSYGLQMARKIKEAHPKLHVVVLWGGVVPSDEVLIFYKRLLGAGDPAEIFVPH